jgi:hypothetical protein
VNSETIHSWFNRLKAAASDWLRIDVTVVTAR